jgi:glycosyltransferase involved in cell wall biosynthesis
LAAPVVLYLVTEDWYFLSHRLPMALAAREAGYEVHVACRVTRDGPGIEAYGFQLHPLNWPRGSLNPFFRLALWRDVRILYRELLPDLVHHVAVEPTIIGSLASLGLPITRLNALAGLGFAFTSRTIKARLAGTLISKLLAFLLNRPGTAALVQNGDDRDALARLGVPANRIFLIAGSGVDTDRLTPLPEPDGPLTVAFAGRLLGDKGIRTLVAAQQQLVAQGSDIHLSIAGQSDPANPASVPANEIARWRNLPNISVLGQVAEISDLWATAHIAVLPSRREGLPKSLLEAAAFGRPLIATDVPGCREIARHGFNALLVPPDDPAALASAIGQLAENPTMRHRFGAAGRSLVEREFSSRKIGQEIVTVYDTLLGRSPLQHRVTSG